MALQVTLLHIILQRKKNLYYEGKNSTRIIMELKTYTYSAQSPLYFLSHNLKNPSTTSTCSLSISQHTNAIVLFIAKPLWSPSKSPFSPRLLSFHVSQIQTILPYLQFIFPMDILAKDTKEKGKPVLSLSRYLSQFHNTNIVACV